MSDETRVHLRLVSELEDQAEDPAGETLTAPTGTSSLAAFWAQYWPYWLLAVIAVWVIATMVWVGTGPPSSPGQGYCDTRLC